ncbi:MAG TPA: 5-deoxy-glucuronate isomerase [Candidatus Dormibacteraeota bacterium]|nr:5-deoxy-glucuronate isomerase [Candidatus Dormibacteraeota bacterium]
MSDVLIHPAVPPSSVPDERLHVLPDPDGAVAVDPERAGWRYLSFRAERLAPGAAIAAGGASEAAVVVIGGGGVRVEAEGAGPIDLPGRSSPFAGLPWAVYLPPGFPARVIGRPDGSDARGVLVAIAEAPPSGRDGVATAPVVVGPADVEIEVRGRGNATRQITKIVRPESPADRLEVVEVYTPSGNWSSWPPHKHDVDDWPAEAVLEEVYYYGFRRPEAWGLQRVYRGDRSRDGVWEVRDGHLVIVPDGYHPFVAGHGDDAYYLNALAGDRRTMACSFDPDIAWVMDTWPSMEPDPRVPMVVEPER